MRQLQMASVVASLLMICGGGGLAAADPVAVPGETPDGGSVAITGQSGDVESNVEMGPESAAKGSRAVTFSGCVSPFSVITHRVTLPAFGSFLHKVFPDRSGFNVVMRVEYPGLFKTINNNGPGRSESYTVRTPFGRVSGKVKISGVRGSFGCYILRVTP